MMHTNGDIDLPILIMKMRHAIFDDVAYQMAMVMRQSIDDDLTYQ